MDEGMQSFLDNWYVEETRGLSARQVWERMMTGLGQYDAMGMSEPLSLASAEFRSPQSYSTMTYSKPAAVLYMLREYVGETAFRRGLQRFYREHALKHVTGVDFFNAIEMEADEDLQWFYDQWFVGVNRLDYGIGDVTVAQEGSEFVTTVEVLRLEDAWMPVTVQVADQIVRLDSSHDRRQLATFRTATRPSEVVVDPDFRLLDMDRSNNTKAL